MDFASPSGFSVRVKCHSFGGWRSQKAAGGFTTHWDDDAQGRFNEKGWFIIEKVASETLGGQSWAWKSEDGL